MEPVKLYTGSNIQTLVTDSFLFTMTEVLLRDAREAKGLSLRKAAEQLGVSHPYLSALELGHKKLNQDRAIQIAKLYELDSPDLLVQPGSIKSDEFTDWLTHRLKWWDSRFVLPTTPGVTKLLSELYVEPTFLFDTGPKSKEELLQDFLSDKKNKALILSGSMGTGKSSFMRILALEASEFKRKYKLPLDCIPFLVSLGNFDLKTTSLTKSLVNYYVKAGYEKSVLKLETLIEHCLNTGQALLLFDGLDEIKSPKVRSHMLATIQQAFEDKLRSSGNKLIISGQEEAFSALDCQYDGFQKINAQRWNTSQMQAATKQWPWPTPQLQQQFWSLLMSNDHVFKIGQWPLLFHLLTTLFTSAGLRPFRELSGLCDACCEVLEESWHSARTSIRTEDDNISENSLQELPWLKWRHFLIFLMDFALHRNGLITSPKLTFSQGEIQEAWEKFLSHRGVELRSMEFAKLEDLLANSGRIGPIIMKRVSHELNGQTETSVEYQFLEDIFGHFYLAKALINDPSLLEQYITKYLRREDWQPVFAFAVQELERSERLSENKLAHQLLELILNLDDELGTEHKLSVGHSGIFTALKGIAFSHSDKHWELVTKPFLDIYMSSVYERDVSIGFNLLGQCSAIPKIRQHFLTIYEDHLAKGENKSPSEIDNKWRIYGALAKLGEHTEVILEEMQREIIDLCSDVAVVDVHRRVETRRIFWSLWQIGRLFMPATAPQNSEQLIGTQKIHAATNKFRKFAYDKLQKEITSEKFLAYSFWDSLIALMNSQASLEHWKDLEKTLNLLLDLCVKHSGLMLNSYPWKYQYIQFLKAASYYRHLVDPKISKNLVVILSEYKTTLLKSEYLDMEVVVNLLSKNIVNKEHELDLNTQLFNHDQIGEYKDWLEILKNHSLKTPSNPSSIGYAVAGLLHSHKLPGAISPDDRISAITLLYQALESELALDTETREEMRIFTLPYTAHGFPIYDHLYNCIVTLSKKLELQVRH